MTAPEQTRLLAQTKLLRVVLYVRISEDPLLLERGVGRQLEDLRTLAAAHPDWQVFAELVDNDVTALTGKVRPAYDRLLELVEHREIDAVVTYMTSRLWRNRRERAEAIERFARARVSVIAVKGPHLDFTTAAGRMLAGVLGEFDTFESEVKGERVARAALQRAQEGRANGAVLFGWRRIYHSDDRGRVTGFEDVEDPEQGVIVREIVQRLLAGDTLNGITADLNRRGAASPGGKPGWGKSSVRKIAVREANVARIMRGRRYFGPASWPSLVSEEEHAEVVALLADPARRTSRGGARRHLLTFGIGECGVCHGRLRVASKRGHQLYVCDGAGCVGRRQDRVNELVRELAVERLSRPDVIESLRPDDAAAREARLQLEALRARQATAADAFAEGQISGEQLARISANLRAQQERAELDLRRATGPSLRLVEAMAGPDAEALWDAATVHAQRGVLTGLGARVVLLRTRQGPGFDPDAVDVSWAPTVQVRPGA